MANIGLWNMPPEYHSENYHPIPQHCAAMRYGAFVQVWATRFGNGRAMAFTDSTSFANFCIFQPGKAELMLGMIECLNHENPPLDSRLWLNILGTIALCISVWFALRGGFQVEWFLCFIALGMAAWLGACELTAMLHRASMPLPEAKKPLLRVAIDRTISNAPLSMGAYVKGENGSGYGLLEQWIPRLRIDGRGCYTIRQEQHACFSGDALVVICPTERVSEDYLRRLTDYVERGGKLLVFDSPESTGTANELLSPFKLRMESRNPLSGALMLKDRWPSIPVETSNQVLGGTPLAEIDGKPVAAVTNFGKGTVMAVGFGSLFNDRNMGDTWFTDPASPIKQRFNVFFAIVRSFLSNKPLEPTGEAFGDSSPPITSSERLKKTPKKPTTPPNLPELPTQELGPKE
jgi:hypothetical protein